MRVIGQNKRKKNGVCMLRTMREPMGRKRRGTEEDVKQEIAWRRKQMKNKNKHY
jgi:hypothetical protein